MSYKIYTLSITLLGLLIFFTNIPTSAQASAHAQELTAQCTIQLSGRQDQKDAVWDKDYQTQWQSAKTGGSIIVLAPEGQPLYGLCLEWDILPGNLEFQALVNGEWTQLPLTPYHFIHQFLQLDGVQGVKVRCQGEPMALNELRVFGQGNLPKDVQIWQPPCEKADMLVFPTHPDDEYLFFGGTLPVYAGQRHLNVQVAYLTQSTRRRRHEALNGLWTVGVRHSPIFSPFADKYASSLAQAEELYDTGTVTAWQVSMIRQFQPEVVVGHDLQGEYGHGVHALNTVCLMSALELAGNRDYICSPEKPLATWNTPKCYLHDWEEQSREMDWDQPLSEFDGKTGAQMAQLGYLCHISQQNGHHELSTQGRLDYRKFGLYRSTVGPDVDMRDFFENTPLGIYRKAASSSSAGSEESPTPQPDNSDSSDQENRSLLCVWPVLLLPVGLAAFFLLRRYWSRYHSRHHRRARGSK